MSDERWEEVFTIFEQAVRHRPEARSRFLDELCGRDTETRRAVDSMLTADLEVDHFIDQPLSWREEIEGAARDRISRDVSPLASGRYRVGRLLGRGGMGEVYQAYDLKLGEQVALKFLPEPLGRDKNVLWRFLREAKIARRITHPHVCRVYDVGELDGRHFLSMEYIDGEDLASLLRRVGRPRHSEAMEILRQLCEGLDAVHREGILHCDLKPANLMIDGQGRLRITDFGIAGLGETKIGAEAGHGTPSYMAPEQSAGDQVSVRTDLYALGLVMYELLTGQRAFVAESAAELARLRQEAPPTPPSALARDLESSVEEVILSCLSIDPRHRPVSALAVLRRLSGSVPSPRLERQGPPQALHQLPPPPADFTGRAADLNEVREAIERGGVTVSGIQGMGGIGKTALALKLAEELTPLYPDAQIYLDLRGASTQPLTTAEAMAHVLRAYRPQAPQPSTEEELAAHYRSALHEQRALLLMDNAAGREQVEALIPPRSSILLVTSRRRFALPGLFAKSLDSLPPSDAVAMLSSSVPRIGDEAENIARLCGYLPIALRLAGGTLAERRDLAPAEYARRLAEGRGRLELIEASLILSYELLPALQQEQWRALAIFPGTFDQAAVSALWELEPEPAEHHLAELVKNGLVEWVEGRYRLHDLARLFAEHRLDSKERLGLEQRYAEYFLSVLREAAELFDRGGEELLPGLGLLDREWTNVQAGQAWSAAHFAEDSSVAKSCSDYATVGSQILAVRLSVHQQIHWLQAALEAARQVPDPFAERHHLAYLGRALASRGEFDHGIGLCDQALALAREIGDREGEHLCLVFLGTARFLHCEVRSAVACFEQALAIARELGDRRREGADLSNLGMAWGALGELRRGIELLDQALVIVREGGDKYREIKILNDLGYLTLNEPRRAIELFEQVLEIERATGFQLAEAHTLTNLAWAYIDVGEIHRPLEMSQRALAIAREYSSHRLQAHALGIQGLTYLTRGETDRAIELIERSFTSARRVGDRLFLSLLSWRLGLHYEATGDLARATELMQVRVDYERAIGHTEAERHAARLDELRARLAP